jgi:hypothetical protein
MWVCNKLTNLSSSFDVHEILFSVTLSQSFSSLLILQDRSEPDGVGAMLSLENGDWFAMGVFGSPGQLKFDLPLEISHPIQADLRFWDVFGSPFVLR